MSAAGGLAVSGDAWSTSRWKYSSCVAPRWVDSGVPLSPVAYVSGYWSQPTVLWTRLMELLEGASVSPIPATSLPADRQVLWSFDISPVGSNISQLAGCRLAVPLRLVTWLTRLAHLTPVGLLSLIGTLLLTSAISIRLSRLEDYRT